jgi:hypothetical protein
VQILALNCNRLQSGFQFLGNIFLISATCRTASHIDGPVRMGSGAVAGGGADLSVSGNVENHWG